MRLAFVSGAAAFALAATSATAADQITAIHASKLVDPVSGKVLNDQTIIVTGDKVTAVGPAATLIPPSGARRIELGRATVLPGLIDSHVHITANANDEGHLYGSVGAAEISRSLKQQDLMVSPDQIVLQGPLKEVGLYTVRVRLASEVEGDLKVWVVPASGEVASK